jgi:general secretion pathway protein G
MQSHKYAFTMVELVFVIVVLGILAAIAIPKFSVTRNDATIAKGRSNVASIRSGIITERQTRLIKGDSDFIKNGTEEGEMDHGGLFGGVLMYPIAQSTGNDGWSATAGSGTYTYKVAGSSNTFKYTPSDGKFLCTDGNECDKLTK